MVQTVAVGDTKGTNSEGLEGGLWLLSEGLIEGSQIVAYLK